VRIPDRGRSQSNAGTAVNELLMAARVYLEAMPVT